MGYTVSHIQELERRHSSVLAAIESTKRQITANELYLSGHPLCSFTKERLEQLKNKLIKLERDHISLSATLADV